ncbi:hypothetical protein IMCC20628_01832 [Hoeflea sp. IMCC20628]|uniref:hypothetical protein n=1 Tax=Hoeflea sp. IMCC20628 TaxID=1620421 RepID=UPI00063AD4A3|nr:hypothetical protein [Hoeflea sp. IMCC20628]AKI00539.1 hypothetical protein IMCC20628_01832 [Hoeflea sp. IMCC20628]
MNSNCNETVAAHIEAMTACGAPYQVMGPGLCQRLIDVNWDAYRRAKTSAETTGITTRDVFVALGGEA